MTKTTQFRLLAATLAAGAAIHTGSAFGGLLAQYSADTLTSSALPTLVTDLPDASGYTDADTGNPNPDLTTAGIGVTLFGGGANGDVTAGYNTVFGGHNYVETNGQSLTAGIRLLGANAATGFASGGNSGTDPITDPESPGADKFSILVIYSNVTPGNNQIAGQSGFNISSNSANDPQGNSSVGNVVSGNAQSNQLTFALLSFSGNGSTGENHQIDLYTAYGPTGAIQHQAIGSLASFEDPAGDFTLGGSGDVDISAIVIFNTDSDPGDAQSIIADGAQASFGDSQAPGPFLPEPASLSVLSLGGLSLLARRRRA